MNRHSRTRRIVLATLAAGLTIPRLLIRPAHATASDDLARELVERADAVRFPRDSFQTDITVTNFSDGAAGDQRKYRVLSRGNDNTIVLTMEPASERGQALLMRGRDLWVFMPNVSQPVRLSVAQRLTGQVANGDLARANFAGDYIPRLIDTDTIDGRNARVLELTADGRGVTYAKVKYWVADDNDQPLKAEFYALSGRLLKTTRYEDYRELAGQIRPTRLVMEDALKQGEVSIMTYDAMALRDLPERMFTREYLRRLQ
ncbi:outer membrane lipoprotein-sorting protein [Rhodocyclaceae bacterium SMB388]